MRGLQEEFGGEVPECGEVSTDRHVEWKGGGRGLGGRKRRQTGTGCIQRLTERGKEICMTWMAGCVKWRELEERNVEMICRKKKNTLLRQKKICGKKGETDRRNKKNEGKEGRRDN